MGEDSNYLKGLDKLTQIAIMVVTNAVKETTVKVYRAWAENDCGERYTIGYFESEQDAFNSLPEPIPDNYERDFGVEEIAIIQKP